MILNYSAKFSHLTYQNYPFATSNFFTARTIENVTNSRTLFPLRPFTKALRLYTVNHKKRGSLFLTITLANINRFLNSFYIILIVKKFYMRL